MYVLGSAPAKCSVMDVSIKRDQSVQTLHTFLPEQHLDLEGISLAPENEELLELRRAIEARNRQWMEHPTVIPPPPPPPKRRASSGNESRRRRHQNETEEQRRARLARDAERRRESRRLESEEDARMRRAKEAAARRQSRQYYRQYLETEADAQRRRYLNAARKRLQRQLMTPEQRDEMRRKGAARQAEKRKRLQAQKLLEKQLGQDPLAPNGLGKEDLKPLLGGGGSGVPGTEPRANSSHFHDRRGAMPIVLPTAIILPNHLQSSVDQKPVVLPPNMVNFQAVAAAGLAPFQINQLAQEKAAAAAAGYINPYNYHC